MVKALLKHGASLTLQQEIKAAKMRTTEGDNDDRTDDTNVVLQHGDSPLMLASRHGHADVVRVLLKHVKSLHHQQLLQDVLEQTSEESQDSTALYLACWKKSFKFCSNTMPT